MNSPSPVAAALALAMAQSATAQTATNPNYVTYPEPALIERDLSGMDQVYRRNYEKFIAYRAPNGGHILLIATDGMSDEQLLRAYSILDFFLTDVPSAQFGSDKSAVANAMADNGAVLVLPDGRDGDSPTPDRALQGQPLYALEFPTEGSVPYVTNDYDQRDAGFEEIFHLVHDYGIGTRFTDGVLRETYQAEIQTATEAAMAEGRWASGEDAREWIEELRAEGSLEQEYIVSVMDSYYGYWGAWREGNGGLWGEYIAKTRAEVRELDPMGYALIPKFLPETVTYMARIDPGFKGTFEMSFDPAMPYTHKSQYLVNARLLGDLPSGLSGNDHDNIFMGNPGDNTINGRGGNNVVQYAVTTDEVEIMRQGSTIVVRSAFTGTDTLTNIQTLRFLDRDVFLRDI